MKKYITIFILFISLSGYGQEVRTLSGYEPATGRPGYIYRDTSIAVPYTAGQYFTGYKTFGSLNDSARAAFSGTANRITITSGVIDVGSDVVTLTGTQTLTNKTLTSPILNTSSTVGYVWTASNTSGAGGWAAGGGGSGWGLTGNSATDSTVNYVGTSDARRLILKTNGLAAITIDNIQNVTLANKLTLPAAQTNFSGQFNWGPTPGTSNQILIYDAGSTALRNGIGYNSSNASMNIFARSYAEGSIRFGLGVDNSTITTANANFYLHSGGEGPTGVPNANGSITVFNGLTKFSSVNIQSYIFPSGTNTSGNINWGAAGSGYRGVRLYDGGSTALRSGLFFNSTDASTVLFGRGGPEFLFGTGFDETNMTTSNATFYINASSKLVINSDVTAGQYRLSALNSAPANATATGTLGEIRVVADFLYVCIATNTWVRAALVTW